MGENVKRRMAQFFGVPEETIVPIDDGAPTPEQLAKAILPTTTLPEVRWLRLPIPPNEEPKP